MYNALLVTMIRFRKNDDGATLVEYGIALGLAIALGGGALAVLATDVGLSFTAASTTLPG
jgi:pilus assembly protein Flp/PilA